MNQSFRLENFPVSFFTIVMGLAGLALAWEKTSAVLGFNNNVHYGLIILATVVFILLAIVYSLKLIRHTDVVLAEFNHPVSLSFFPAITISLLLLSGCSISISLSLAEILWVVGASLHLLLLLLVLNSWINKSHFEIQHMSPVWFIPAVGNVIVPITGVTLGYPEVSWFFFSIGLLFWLILLAIVMNRILFHEPLPKHLEPTLFILVAPPAVGFISYAKLVGDIDGFARMLYYLALFFTLFMITQLPRLLKLPFFISWWAYTFPLAAMTIATWGMFEYTGLAAMKVMALVFLATLSVAVTYLSYKTLRMIRAN